MTVSDYFDFAHNYIHTLQLLCQKGLVHLYCDFITLCIVTLKPFADFVFVSNHVTEYYTHTHVHTCPVLLSHCLKGHATSHKGKDEGKVVVISFSCSICGQSVLPCYGTTAGMSYTAQRLSAPTLAWILPLEFVPLPVRFSPKGPLAQLAPHTILWLG